MKKLTRKQTEEWAKKFALHHVNVSRIRQGQQPLPEIPSDWFRLYGREFLAAVNPIGAHTMDNGLTWYWLTNGLPVPLEVLAENGVPHHIDSQAKAIRDFDAWANAALSHAMRPMVYVACQTKLEQLAADNDRVPPFDPNEINLMKATWAGMAVAVYMTATGCLAEFALIDLLTDLHHWADRHSPSWEIAAMRASNRYAQEIEEVQR